MIFFEKKNPDKNAFLYYKYNCAIKFVFSNYSDFLLVIVSFVRCCVFQLIHHRVFCSLLYHPTHHYAFFFQK